MNNFKNDGDFFFPFFFLSQGVLTPFDRLGGFERRVQSDDPSAAAANEAAAAAATSASIAKVGHMVKKLRDERHTTKLVDHSELPRKERHTKKVDEHFWRAAASGHNAVPKKRRMSTLPRAAPRRQRQRRQITIGEDSDEDDDEDERFSDALSSGEEEELLDESGKFDDADEAAYLGRQKAYRQKQHREKEDTKLTAANKRKKEKKKIEGDGSSAEEENEGDNEEIEIDDDDEEEEEEEIPDIIFEGGFRVPGDLYSKLFDYQRTGLKWLWELHTQRAGGIIGDEMGLGKTIQIIAFLAGLHHSGKFKPSLIICPATVLNQWLREIRAWYPPFRVAILHESAVSRGGKKSSAASRAALVKSITSSESGILLTTYEQLRLRRELLLPVAWGCAILDEGHKIQMLRLPLLQNNWPPFID